MDASFATQFIKSTKNVFQTMLDLTVTVGKPKLLETVPNQEFDVTGLIGMSGDIVGVVMS